MTAAVVITSGDSHLHENLRGVDALCSRWAHEAFDYAGGGAHPLWRLMRERAGASLPGGKEVMSNEVLILDGILANAEPRYRSCVTVWYCEAGPIVSKAKRLGTNRTDLYATWRRTLEYLRGRLHAEGVDV
jgi:hypothetical protein